MSIPLNELALFAGAGGGILGGRLLGWRTVCAVEIDRYAASVLIERQNDGSLQPFPIWDDVRTFDGEPWRGLIDVVSGGFPCTDISSAGKGAGIEGEKSGLWKEMARIIGEVRPRRFAFMENSPMLTSRGLGTVLGDLAEMGFDAEWGVLGARHAGAPHRRDRIWILARDSNRKGESALTVDDETSGMPSVVADASLEREREPTNEADSLSGERDAWLQPRGGSQSPRKIPDSDHAQREGNERAQRVAAEYPNASGASWWQSEPDVGRVAHGVAARMDRLRAIGNGQVPAVAALAWRTLIDRNIAMLLRPGDSVKVERRGD